MLALINRFIARRMLSPGIRPGRELVLTRDLQPASLPARDGYAK